MPPGESKPVSGLKTAPVRDKVPASYQTTAERLGVAHLRAEEAGRRDLAAQERDARAARRDREADIGDRTALEFADDDGRFDAATLEVGELRAHGLEVRQRALFDRKRAKRDRGFAEIDRVLGSRDREESKRDREQAGIDELTGARRRGVGLEDLQREIERSRRTGDMLVAAYVDVDGLKAVNDQHGHQAGDELLQDVVEGLRRDLRAYDLIVRLGGDEFLCIMPGITTDQARKRFKHLESELSPGPTNWSVSIGLSELHDGDSPRGLINRADHDLRARQHPRRP